MTFPLLASQAQSTQQTTTPTNGALIYTNGELISIQAQGTSADYDVPAAPGEVRWSGTEGITIRRDPVIEQQTGQIVDVIQRTRLELNYGVGSLVQTDDVVTYVYAGVTYSRRVEDISRQPMVGRVRLELEPA